MGSLKIVATSAAKHHTIVIQSSHPVTATRTTSHDWTIVIGLFDDLPPMTISRRAVHQCVLLS